MKTAASPDPANGVLYWRVRALTADGTLSCASAAKVIVVDGGQWAPDSPVDNGNARWTFSWAHTGEGIARYKLEFSVTSEFAPGARNTVKVPSGAILGQSCTLMAADIGRLRTMASRAGVTGLYWRVRGDDGDRKFICYSNPFSIPWPVP